GLLFALLLTLVASNPVAAQSPPNPDLVAPPVADLVQEIEAYGNVPLIVQFRIPGSDASVAGIRAVDEAAIAHAQQAGLARLAGHEVANVKIYPIMPLLALTVFDAEALALLYEDPSIAVIQEDIPVPPLLNDSVETMQAHHAHTLFYYGAGQAIAILDTGVA